MNPSEIAKLITEDVHDNNGLILEYKMNAHLVPLLIAYHRFFNNGFGFSLDELNTQDMNKVPRFTAFWNRVQTRFKEMFPETKDIREIFPSATFSDLIKNPDPELILKSDDKLVSVLRSLMSDKVEAPKTSGIPDRTTALADRPRARQWAAKRAESHRLSRM